MVFGWNRTMLMRSLALSVLVGVPLGSQAAHAVTPTYAPGDWIETEGGRVRLVLGSARIDGTVRGALEIDLEPGWKTYWIAPGPAGIAPQFETWRSENLTLDRVDYPAPIRFYEAYGTSVGYDMDVVFSFTFRVDDPEQTSRLSMSGLIGVCEDICIPVQFAIDGLVRTGMSTSFADGRVIRAAANALPELGDASTVSAKLNGDHILLSGEPFSLAAEVFTAHEGASLGEPERTEAGFSVPVLGGAVENELIVVVRSSGDEARYVVPIE